MNKASGNLRCSPGGVQRPRDHRLARRVERRVTMKVDYYPSNEDLITKLSAANGNSGFDIVVPTGAYIPQMIEKGLLQKFDKALLPNMVNVDPLYMARDWDPTNDYSVCKNWGSTGFFYNTTDHPPDGHLAGLPRRLHERGERRLLGARHGPEPVRCLLLGERHQLDDRGSRTDLDACEAYMVDQFAQHIKAFDSYPRRPSPRASSRCR
ncbi:MAG: extracellular solute-binding protein [Ilumatobacteraceae bacterium]